MTSPLPRELTRSERAVLEAMLSVDFAGVEVLRRSAERAVVTGTCGCGCPTIHFRPHDPDVRQVLVSSGVPDEDREQSVLLFANDDGELEALELEWLTPSPPTRFPEAGDLRVWPTEACAAKSRFARRGRRGRDRSRASPRRPGRWRRPTG